MKKILSLIFITGLMLNIMGISAFSISPTEYQWFCQRSGHSQPKENGYESLIKKYDGYCIDRRVGDEDAEKVIYITFDCGYENGNIEKILNTLKEENVKSAFFLLDNIILKNTELVTRMADEGHIICNHTKNHKNICNYSTAEIEKNLQELETIYREKTGREMSKYFRFPEGRFSENALKSLQSLGYKTIFWSFAYADWDNNRQINADAAMKKILDNTHNGAIMLFHPTSRVNAEIFPELIRAWKNMGYTFGTLDDLCKTQ